MPTKGQAGPSGKRTNEVKRKSRPKVELPEEMPEDPTSLRETDVPGVYLNSRNVRVDERGIAISFLTLKQKDEERWEEVIGGRVDSPAKLLKAVALDPRQPLFSRVDAAKSAAPYFDRKQPQALDGGLGDDGKVVPLFDADKLKGLTTKELAQLRDLLKKGAAV